MSKNNKKEPCLIKSTLEIVTARKIKKEIDEELEVKDPENIGETLQKLVASNEKKNEDT